MQILSCFSRSSNLVAKALGSDDGDLIADALVGLEVEGELGVVPLNDDLGGLLDGLGTDATHFGGIGLLDVGRWVVSESLEEIPTVNLVLSRGGGKVHALAIRAQNFESRVAAN